MFDHLEQWANATGTAKHLAATLADDMFQFFWTVDAGYIESWKIPKASPTFPLKAFADQPPLLRITKQRDQLLPRLKFLRRFGLGNPILFPLPKGEAPIAKRA